jgi:hypothetical protein
MTKLTERAEILSNKLDYYLAQIEDCSDEHYDDQMKSMSEWINENKYSNDELMQYLAAEEGKVAVWH